MFAVMRYFSLLALCAVLLAGCATVPPGFRPLGTERGRLKHLHYSVELPSGDDWYLTDDGHGSILIVKKPHPRTHTFFLGVMLAAVEPTWKDAAGFLEALKQQKALDSNPKRFKVLLSEYVLYPTVGEYCLHHHLRAEDNGAPRPDGAPFLILDTIAIGCMQPDEQDLYLEVFASERSKPGEASAEFQAIGERFINSLRFEDAHAQP